MGQGGRASIERVASTGSLRRIKMDFSTNRFEEWSIPDSDLDLRGATVVGEGGTGKVYAALYQGVPVAVKVLHTHGMEADARDGGGRREYAATADAREAEAGQRRQMVKDMAQEIRVACMLAAECTTQHPNLAVFVGASINELDSLKIVYELVEGSDLVNC